MADLCAKKRRCLGAKMAWSKNFVKKVTNTRNWKLQLFLTGLLFSLQSVIFGFRTIRVIATTENSYSKWRELRQNFQISITFELYVIES